MRHLPGIFVAGLVAAVMLSACSDDEQCDVEVVECMCEHGVSHTDACTGACVFEPDCVR